MNNTVIECSVCRSRLMSPTTKTVSRAYDHHRSKASSKQRVLLVVGDCFLVGLHVSNNESHTILLSCLYFVDKKTYQQVLNLVFNYSGVLLLPFVLLQDGPVSDLKRNKKMTCLFCSSLLSYQPPDLPPPHANPHP